MDAQFPIRTEIKEKIALLRHSKLSPEEVSAWAINIMNDDAISREIVASDIIAWKVLVRLGGADLFGVDRPYLYGNEDFDAWEAELKK